MKKNYDINDFINTCQVTKMEDATIFIKDGIRYVDKPNTLIVDFQKQIQYDAPLVFTMDRVEIILKHLGLNQVDLANELGLSRKAITKYKNTDDPRASTFSTLRNALYRMSGNRSDGKLYLSMAVEELFF